MQRGNTWNSVLRFLKSENEIYTDRTEKLNKKKMGSYLVLLENAMDYWVLSYH